MNWEAAGALGEIAGALAVVASLVYLARQVRMSNRLARAEAFRAPNSDLNVVNTGFATDPTFRAVFRQIVTGATRAEVGESERILIDFYLVSATNIQEQLAREIREGIVSPDAVDFGGKGLFQLPYYRASWPLYRAHLNSVFAADFEKRFDLDPSMDAQW